jgi:hypothetical protein
MTMALYAHPFSLTCLAAAKVEPAPSPRKGTKTTRKSGGFPCCRSRVRSVISIGRQRLCVEFRTRHPGSGQA